MIPSGKLSGNVVTEDHIEELIRELQFAAIKRMRITKRITGSITYVTNYPEPHHFSVGFETLSPDRDLFYARAREIAAQTRACAVICVSEVWGVSYPIDPVPEAEAAVAVRELKAAIREGRVAKPRDHANREEAVLICAHSSRKQSWMATIRRAGGRPHLAPFQPFFQGLEGEQYRILPEGS